MTDSAPVLHPVVISQVIVNFAARHGVEGETCLLGTGIAAEDLNDSEMLIRREQEMRLIENLILALPEVPALGFELGTQYSIATFGIWGFALRTSQNLRQAAQRSLRYLPLSTAYCRFSIIDSASEFGLLVDPDPIPPALRQFLLERDTATCITLLRELGLAGIPIQGIEYAGPAPAYADRIEELCGQPVRFGGRRNALLLDPEHAAQRLPTYDANLARMLEDQCRAQLDKRQVAGIVGQVREQLLGPLGLVASLEQVAERLAMSERSLRRRLDAEGTSFRALVEGERRQLAAQLLTTTQMKIDEVALQLGYADTASFTRAFRRWFEVSPGAYRRP